MNASADSAQPTKFSRYRSVRKAVAREDYGAPPVPEIPATTSQVTRAPSRYRRPTAQRTHDVPLPTTSPPQREEANSPRSPIEAPYARPPQTSNMARQAAAINARMSIESRRESRDQSLRMSGQRPRGLSTPATSDCPSSMRASSDAAREEARLILEGEHDRLAKMRAQQFQSSQRYRVKRAATEPPSKSTSHGAEPLENTILPPVQEKSRNWIIGPANGPPQRKKKEEQPSVQTREVVARPETRGGNGPPQLKRQVQPPSMPDTARNGNGPPQLKRTVQKQRQQERRYVDAPQNHNTGPTQPAATDLPLPPSQAPKSTALSSDAKRLAPPAETFDAPVSAVNAGERRVSIEYEGFKITLPVTPTTTAKDLLNSASVCMSKPVDPRTSILLEVFGQLGLERPLRKYERIRDVLNSWDSDSQNHLLILPAADCDAKGLDLKDAPEREPGTVMLQMYHSQKPGKWERHWVILRSDGQVTASKRENDGNAPNIFHISDYDVYMPTKQQQKKLKPPKKVCFAVKSQQKSAMFLEGANYAHFFATSEKSVADTWYNAIQSWRSWWLVEMLGEGKTNKPPPADAMASIGHLERPSTAHSRDSIPYQLGSFQPLLEFSADDFSYGEDLGRISEDKGPSLKATKPQAQPLIDFASNRKSFDQNAPVSPRRSSRPRDVPPSSFPNRFVAENSDSLGSDQAFTGKGLLARAHSTKRSQGGDTSGHGLAGTKGKPLVDWTPNSEFVNGSLLRKLEDMNYNEPLKIDRSKTTEANIRVGEGM